MVICKLVAELKSMVSFSNCCYYRASLSVGVQDVGGGVLEGLCMSHSPGQK